jgi:hypothetical protein
VSTSHQRGDTSQLTTHFLTHIYSVEKSSDYEAVLISRVFEWFARQPPLEESTCADASDGNSSDYSRCLCFVVLRTVSFIQIRRAAHSFERDSAALATSLDDFRADADRSHVTGQSG